MGNLLKDRHNLDSPRKDLCFVHAHLSTNAKMKTEKVAKEYLLLSQNEQHEGAPSRILPSWDVNPLSISDEFLFRNNFNDQKKAFHSNKEDFTTLKGIISL